MDGIINKIIESNRKNKALNELADDWRTLALKALESDIKYWSARYQNQHDCFNDIQQELTSHLWKKLPKFDPEGKATIRTWAGTVLRFKCIDLWRVASKQDRSIKRKDKE